MLLWLFQVGELIEKELILLGCTAIMDKIQEVEFLPALKPSIKLESKFGC
jgi:hypothetical protein